MRTQALAAARLDDPGLEVLDAGAGTGFTTEGIVDRVPAERVTMLDQSPHQLARARAQAGAGRLPQAARRRGAAAVRGRRPSTATCRPAASSTGPTRSAASPRRTGCCGRGRRGRRDRAGRAGQPDPPAARRQRGCCSRPSTSTARGSSAPGFEDVAASTSLAPDWYRGRSAYAVADRGRQARAHAGAGVAAATDVRGGPRRAAHARGPRALRRPLRARLGRRRSRSCRSAPRSRCAPGWRAADDRRGRRRRPRPRGERAVALLAPAHDRRHRRERRRAVRDRRVDALGERRRRPRRLPPVLDAGGRPVASTSSSSASTRSPTSRSTASTSRTCRSPPATSDASARG